MSGVDLRGATLLRSNLTRAQLTGATIDGANFFEAALDGTLLEQVVGARLAKHLIATRVGGGPLYFDTAIRSWPERWVDWERIRIFGRLPLFGASYTGLIVIPAYLYFLSIYNDNVQAARAWTERTLGTTAGLPATAASGVLAHLHPEPIPDSFLLLFVSTLFLAIASTIYALWCPSRIKTFSRDQWRDELAACRTWRII